MLRSNASTQLVWRLPWITLTKCFMINVSCCYHHQQHRHQQTLKTTRYLTLCWDLKIHERIKTWNPLLRRLQLHSAKQKHNKTYLKVLKSWRIVPKQEALLCPLTAQWDTPFHSPLATEEAKLVLTGLSQALLLCYLFLPSEPQNPILQCGTSGV